MALLTNYQNLVLESLKRNNFLGATRIIKFKGRCHDALIGEWINWWLERSDDGMICNPARGSRSGSRRYVADLLFLERFEGFECYEVRGIGEVENSRRKFMHKIDSLASYEKYTRQGSNVYPNLEFAILCYTLDIPNDELAQSIYDRVLQVSENSGLLWIVCEIGRSLTNEERNSYCIYMPHFVKGCDRFSYCRNFSSAVLYFVKNAKQIQDVIIPNNALETEARSR